MVNGAIPTTPPAPGEERVELVAALRSLVTHAQAFNSRGQTGATIRALQCFDALRERSASASIELPADLIDRIRNAAKFGRGRKYLAVPIDLADVELLLTVVDRAQELAAVSQAVPACALEEASVRG